MKKKINTLESISMLSGLSHNPFELKNELCNNISFFKHEVICSEETQKKACKLIKLHFYNLQKIVYICEKMNRG